MMIVKRAIVEWIPYEQGGRRKPPTGEEPPVYWAVVKFIDEVAHDRPPTNSWGLVVRLIELLDGPFHWLAEVCFRFEDAPQHLLADGSRFELYEGKKLVARGRLLAENELSATSTT